ncbi:MAG: metallophosphatase family protein [Candidatus Riflebacteria bacterium]|nr:metallophosphatase family protein [Candidatus Riflebacteria bacterium]
MIKKKTIGLIGDVHCQNNSLEKTIEFLRDKCDQIFCTGDIVDGKGDPNKCVELLKKNDIPTVLGNHDRWALSNQMRALSDATNLDELHPISIDFLKSCPATINFETHLGRALVCHGLGENDMCRLTPDDSNYALESNDEFQKLQLRYDLIFILFGHTHRRMVKKIKHQFFINPGSLLPEHDPGFQILDFFKQEVIQYEHTMNGVREIEKFKI